MTAANQWTFVEIELLATVGWKCGCRSFHCPCSQNVTHCRKEICSTCLSKKSISVNPLEISKHPLPTRSLRCLRAAVRSTISPLYYGFVMPIPSLQLQKSSVLRKEAQRLVTELWSPKFVTIPWLYSQSWCVTSANQWPFVETEFLATVGWKWGCQPFSCPCSQNVKLCRKEICSTCLSKESMPCVKSKCPLPTRSFRFPRAAVRSTTSALWLHFAHPFVAAAEKNAHLMQRSRAFGHGVVVSKICYNTVIVLSIVLCDCCKPMNNCRDWGFSKLGLEVWLPAFQPPMFAKCDTLPNGDLFGMFV